MSVSAAGRGLAKDIVGIEEQQVLPGLSGMDRLAQGKQEGEDKGGSFHWNSFSVAG
jgi:hypothetical protein